MADQTSVDLVVNGEHVRAVGVRTTTTALAWLRESGRTGTKEGCGEGDCGACTIALVERTTDGAAALRAVPACLVPLPALAGREILTVEGVTALAAHSDEQASHSDEQASHSDEQPPPGGAVDKPGGDGAPPDLHPAQRALRDRSGSQCGFCTPGIVMSLVAACDRPGVEADKGRQAAEDRAEIVDHLAGNICRCTGYRPIREAAADALASAHAGRRAEPGRRAAPPLDRADFTDPEGARFLRPASLAELLAVKAERGASAVLLGGATEVGVLAAKTGARFPLLVATEGVPELRAVESDEREWRVGGAVTLTDLGEAVGAEYPHVAEMLRVFASRQIRNRATLAGNLATAAPIGDMAPVLLAIDADLVLERASGSRRVALADFVTGYRQTLLAPDEVIRWVVLPRRAALEVRVAPGGRLLLGSAKVAGRRHLAISTVATGFAVGLGADGRVTHARLAFGGVAPTPWRARRAEEALLGRAWPEDVGDAVEILHADLRPIDDVRGSAAYRREVAANMLARFAAGDDGAAAEDFLPTQPWVPDPGGRDLPHESATLHVTGAARFVDDGARRRPMLEIWPVLSTQARARILAVDVTAALAVPGVVRVLTAHDVPGRNEVGSLRPDEPLLADAEVAYHGEPVALVVGEDRAACRRGAAAVTIAYEPLEPVLGIADAIEKGSFHTAPDVIRRGDVAAALAAAPHVLTGEFLVAGQAHAALETHTAWAEEGEAGTVFVSSATQNPSEVQAVVAEVLGRPRNGVTVECPRMGGGFGGKETQAARWAAAAALAAHATGRPVRVALDRDVHMHTTGKRHPFLAGFEVGFDDDGALLAARIRLTADGGHALDLSQAILDRALLHLDNAYFLPAVEFAGRVARTNLASNTAMRGFGGPQGMIVIEEILDRVARRLGLPPEVVRERNLYRGTGASRTTPYGQELPDLRIREIWDSLLASSRFAERRMGVTAANAAAARAGSRRRRGLAITPVKFGISFTASVLNQAGAYVLVYRDGTVQVNHGGTEMGQGLHTKMRGVAARELGVRPEQVRVMATRTDKVPNTSATAASSGADLNGQAVRIACEILRERLAPFAADLLGAPSSAAGRRVVVPPASVTITDGVARSPVAPGAAVPFAEVAERAYLAQVPLSAAGYYRTPGIGMDWATGTGRPFRYFAYGAAVSEVEVDGWTGQTRVLAVDILHDVGESLDPRIDRGQVEGAFVQGMGWVTGERLVRGPGGDLLTHGLSTYLVPTIGDAPARFDVRLLPRAAQEGVIHGSKAVGEPPLMLALSVREAIRDAVASFAAFRAGPDARATEDDGATRATADDGADGGAGADGGSDGDAQVAGFAGVDRGEPAEVRLETPATPEAGRAALTARLGGPPRPPPPPPRWGPTPGVRSHSPGCDLTREVRLRAGPSAVCRNKAGAEMAWWAGAVVVHPGHMPSAGLPLRIVEVPVPESLDGPEGWLLHGAVAVERAAEAAAMGYPDLSDTPLEAWSFARSTDYARRVRLAAVVTRPAPLPAERGVVRPIRPHQPSNPAFGRRDGRDGRGGDAVVVGSAFLELPNPDGDNAHLVEATVRVDPAWTGRGVGSALAGALEARARAEGRRLIVTWTDHAPEPPEPADPDGEARILRPATGSGRLPLDAATRFALAHGYALEQAERHSILDLPADGALLAGLERGARTAAGPDYRVLTWGDAAPEEWLDAYAVLTTRMSTDVPMAGLEIEEDVWDAERIRDLERTQRECGRRTLVAAAEHIPSRTLAAFTVLIVRPGAAADEPPAVFQDSTLVLREHRGRRLGTLVKVVNVGALAVAFPTARRIHTWNAEENAHMLDINVAIGFRPAGISGTWQKHLD